MHAPATVTFEHVSISVHNTALLRDVSLVASPGDIWLVEGANGSGKSTFLRALAGLHPMSAGRIMLGSEDLHKSPLYPRCIQWLGHKRGIHPELSVLDHVTHWAHMQGVPENIELALHYFSLHELRHVPCGTLSAGTRERVALTRLLLSDAWLWLLDEPMSHLDAASAGLLQALIITRVEQGGIVFMSTHARIESNRVNRIDITDEAPVITMQSLPDNTNADVEVEDV